MLYLYGLPQSCLIDAQSLITQFLGKIKSKCGRTQELKKSLLVNFIKDGLGNL